MKDEPTFTSTTTPAPAASLPLEAPPVETTTTKDSLTMKLPPVVREALDREAAKWGQSAPEFLRAFLAFAMRQPEGVQLKLHAQAPEVQQLLL